MTELTVRGHEVRGRIDSPADPTGGVVVLPGMNHGPFEDVFDRFTERAVADGRAVCRLAPWESRDDLADLSLATITDALAAGVTALRDRGVEPVDALGKSFGGGMALTDPPDECRRLVLWAPAIRVGETGTVASIRDRPLREVDEIRVGTDRLREIDQPTLLLHGEADESVARSVSRRIADAVPRGRLRTLADADHSFTGPAAEPTVERTLAFLDRTGDDGITSA